MKPASGKPRRCRTRIFLQAALYTTQGTTYSRLGYVRQRPGRTTAELLPNLYPLESNRKKLSLRQMKFSPRRVTSQSQQEYCRGKMCKAARFKLTTITFAMHCAGSCADMRNMYAVHVKRLGHLLHADSLTGAVT